MRTIKIAIATLILSLSTGLILHSAPMEKTEPKKAQEYYNEARRALHRQEWQQAIQDLNRLIKEFSQDPYVDDAYYWLGYSLNQLSRSKDNNNRSLSLQIEALSQLETLLKKFSTSKWVDEARLLRIEIAEDLVKKGLKEYKKYIINGATVDDGTSLKFAALDALLQMDSEKAFPILEKAIKQNGDPRTRNRAIYVLGQSGDPRGIPLLLETATKDSDRKTKDNAIFWLGQYGTPEALAALEKLFYQSGEEKTKEQVIYALTQNDNKAGIKKIILFYKNEKSDKLKKKIIFALGRSEIPVAREFLEEILLKK